MLIFARPSFSSRLGSLKLGRPELSVTSHQPSHGGGQNTQNLKYQLETTGLLDGGTASALHPVAHLRCHRQDLLPRLAELAGRARESAEPSGRASRHSEGGLAPCASCGCRWSRGRYGYEGSSRPAQCVRGQPGKGAERRERGFVHLDCASTGLDVLLGGARKAANDRWVGSGSYGFGNVLHRSALVTPRR